MGSPLRLCASALSCTFLLDLCTFSSSPHDCVICADSLYVAPMCGRPLEPRLTGWGQVSWPSCSLLSLPPVSLRVGS